MKKIITNILKIVIVAVVFMPFMKAEAAPVCTLTANNENETIVQMPKEVLVALVGRTDASGNVLKNKNWATGLSVPAGKYSVIAQTYDGHSEHGGQGQTKEQLNFWFYAASGIPEMARLGPTSDIPENADYQTTNIGTANLGSTLTIVGISHQYIGGSTLFESVYPVCLKLTNIAPPVVSNPDVTCSVSDTTLNVGSTAVFTAQTVGGNSPYSYVWSNTVSGTGSQISKVFNTVGTYVATVTVTDSNGKTDVANCSPVVVTQNDPGTPSVSCTVSDTSVEKGDSVTFTSHATGGNGSYTYAWSNAVSGSASQISKTFNSTGSYVATVTIYDGNGRSDSANCPTVVVSEEVNDDSDELEIECKVSDSSIEEGDRITIKVEIDGGEGPYDIQWDGDTDEVDDFDDEDRSQSVRFDDAGRYEFEVTVEDDNGDEDSDTCTVRVSDNNDNTVSSVNDAQDSNLASLSSVYLNQVPYTGPEETAKLVGFISLVILWSAIIAHYMLRNRKMGVISSRVNAFKQANLANKI